MEGREALLGESGLQGQGLPGFQCRLLQLPGKQGGCSGGSYPLEGEVQPGPLLGRQEGPLLGRQGGDAAVPFGPNRIGGREPSLVGVGGEEKRAEKQKEEEERESGHRVSYPTSLPRGKG